MISKILPAFIALLSTEAWGEHPCQTFSEKGAQTVCRKKMAHDFKEQDPCKNLSGVDLTLCQDDTLLMLEDFLNEIIRADGTTASGHTEWKAKRPTDQGELEGYYGKRILNLLRNSSKFDAIVMGYLKSKMPSFESWGRSGELYDHPVDTGPVLTLIMRAYNARMPKPVFEESEMFKERLLSSSNHLTPNGDLVILLTEDMFAYQMGLSFWYVDMNSKEFTPTRLKIPSYDRDSKKVIYEESATGSPASIDKDHILIHYKGVGYGGQSTDRKLKIENKSLVLKEQKETKDNFDSDYQLKGDEADWVTTYPVPSKKS